MTFAKINNLEEHLRRKTGEKIALPKESTLLNNSWANVWSQWALWVLSDLLHFSKDYPSANVAMRQAMLLFSHNGHPLKFKETKDLVEWELAKLARTESWDVRKSVSHALQATAWLCGSTKGSSCAAAESSQNAMGENWNNRAMEKLKVLLQNI
jgi:hypothetical protein